MPLSAGTRLGPYEIVAPIGAGGMGEVYRATDTKLGRAVAIKVIPPAFAQDADRMARFTREAQVLASLNHPNIAAIYGVEENALVMELVEGTMLCGPMPPDQALPILHQLIDALEYAHEKGIVHRDLKPANIKVTPEGRVKVLDFGLAKAMTGDPAQGDPESSPTLTMRGTMAGMIIGTAAYMSPEQARGKPVDKRSDIFSFGAVIFELLTGRQAFGGETISDSLAVILTKEPDRALLPADTPPNFRRLLDRCLEKEPRRRLRDIGEARILLEQPIEAAPPTGPDGLRPARLPWAIAAAALLIAGGAITWALLRAGKPTARPVFRFTVPFQWSRGPVLAMSHDGSKLAFKAGTSAQIHLRLADQLEAKAISGTEGAASPVFSPDDQWLAFGQGVSIPERKVKKVQVSGGAVITLCEGNPFGLDWGRDGNIIFGTSAGLARVSAAGGKPEVLTTPDRKKGETSHRLPYILPGGDAVLFNISGAGSTDEVKIAALSLKTRVQKVLLEGGINPQYVPGAAGGKGYLVYWHAGSVFAIRFDPSRLEVSGSAVPVLEGVFSLPSRLGLVGAMFTFSDTGAMAYLPGAAGEVRSTLVWVNRQGQEQPEKSAPVAAQQYRSLRLSPDGKLAAISIGDGNQDHLVVYDPARGTLTRLSFQGNADYPVWTPDGKYITFGQKDSGKSSIVQVPADGSGPPRTLASVERMPVLNSWSPDGKILTFHYGDPPTPTDIWLLTVGTATPQRYQETPYDKFAAQFSPEGRWFAYGATIGSGTIGSGASSQVYVQPAPSGAAGAQPAGKWQVSVDGGTGPRWSRNGRELFFRNGNKVMVAPIEPGATFRAGTPRMLFEGQYGITYPSGGGYDVSADGKRFLMIKYANPDSTLAQIHFVLEWFDEVRRRVETGGTGQ